MAGRKYPTIPALIDADERGEFDDSTFDDELWGLVIERISSPTDVAQLPRPVGLYYASRFVQWDVGNGGFAQVAYNAPEWLEPAAIWYEEVGLPRFASLIRQAIELLPTANAFDAKEIGTLFEQFSESELASLDERLDGSGWEADARRIQYVRDNRQAFRDVA